MAKKEAEKSEEKKGNIDLASGKSLRVGGVDKKPKFGGEK